MQQYINTKYKEIISLSRLYKPLMVNEIYSLKRGGQSSLSYNGYQNCGPISYITSYFIHHKYPTSCLRAGYSSSGYGKYSEDHICILLDDIIIDPTYKQFLDSPYCDGKSEYSKYLYETLPPFFVGQKEELQEIITKLQAIEKRIFDKNFLKLEIIDEWWSFNDEPPYEFDLYYLVNKKKAEQLSENKKKIIDVLANYNNNSVVLYL